MFASRIHPRSGPGKGKSRSCKGTGSTCLVSTGKCKPKIRIPVHQHKSGGRKHCKLKYRWSNTGVSCSASPVEETETIHPLSNPRRLGVAVAFARPRMPKRTHFLDRGDLKYAPTNAACTMQYHPSFTLRSFLNPVAAEEKYNTNCEGASRSFRGS